jgi:hypothetical protein
VADYTLISPDGKYRPEWRALPGRRVIRP